jgi:hypothetical protein
MSEPGPHSQPDEAMVDLLIKQVTEGLSPAEQRELDVLDDDAASGYLRDFERAAAAIALATSANSEAMPARLRQRLDQSARTFFGAAPAAGGAADNAHSAQDAARTDNAGGAQSAQRSPPPPAPQPAPAAARNGYGSGAYGWWAAAACLVLAALGWLRPPSPVPPPVAGSLAPPAAIAPPTAAPIPSTTPTPPAPAAAAEARAALLAEPSTLKIKMAATKDPGGAGATGDVVWDPATQRGYLHFVGLAPNDPTVHQYQLWIFDGARDQRYPVDGGVFDIPANGRDVIVPIHAAIAVLKAAAFAVTVERPGGVVVSGREHIVVLGAAG